VASYYFYISWNAKYAILLSISVIITWISGFLIEWSNKRGGKHSILYKKLWLGLSITLNISILCFFKYINFFADGIARILSMGGGCTPSLSHFDIILPVGISFYTFQALSYMIDVYRGEVAVERNLAKYTLFVSFFPQLVAGPIERSKDLLPQIHQKHYFNFSRIKDSLLLMLWGYFEKVVIADRVAILVNTVYGDCQNYVGFQVVIATFFFAIQIYCDFAGYSHIAKGAAQVLGFKLVNNFAEPYLATSIHDFWRRWHISLSTWLRDYVYIPLGGNRSLRLKNIEIL
jgi:D-alanyl-lipoteichoic acid acyltransferase DltB (MBOAT superfamily)